MGKVNSMIEQNGVVYYLEEASTKTIEKYDEHLIACVKDTDFNYVRGYFGEIRELDLSWLDYQDIIELKANKGLRRIHINCSNVRNAILNVNEPIICDINVDCNVVVAGAALKRFLVNNIDTLAMINLHNVSNPIVKTYLEEMVTKYELEVDFVDYGIQLEADEISNELVA